MEHGCPGPLGSMCLLVMAWATNHQPSPRLTGLVLSWTFLPTQLMAPNNVNMASHTLPKVSPSLMIAACRTGLPGQGLLLLPVLGQICHLRPRLLQLAPARHEGMVVSLPHLWWRSPVFPNNTESQVDQVLVSLLGTRMVNVIGHSQMPLDLQGHSGCLVV